jgi:cytochrome c peroxidase
MRPYKSFILVSFLTVLITMVLISGKAKDNDKSKAVLLIGTIYQQEMKRLDSLLEQYPKYFYDSNYSSRRNVFDDLTCQVKRVEALFTYYHPNLAAETFFAPPQFQKRDFGPPFPDNWVIVGPFGIEPDSILQKTSTADSLLSRKFIERAVTNFRKVISSCQYGKEVETMNEEEIFDALRLQMIRLTTIGISNADFAIDETTITALESSFQAWGDLVMVFSDQLPATQSSLKKNIEKTLTEGKGFFKRQPTFKDFDRVEFLTNYLIPLSNHLAELQNALGIKSLNTFTALRPGARHVYEADAFNVDFFAPGKEAAYSPAKAALGKLLFFDPILSDNNKRACASCHKPEMAFTDGNVKSLNFDMGDLARNAPTVINSAFQKSQFWDLRATSLEDQLDSVINNADELHSSFERVIDRINSSTEYRQLFTAAFPETKKTGIQRKHVKIAIATYERMLTGLNSRFDQYIRGDRSKLNEAEVNGLNLFLGKAKCATCHYAPLFAAALPPYFEFTDHRSIGVPLKDTMIKYQVDPDTGASKPFNNSFFHFSFKIPTVRNVELTAPYMHNGVFKSLEQVVDFYNDAGGIKFIKDMRPGMKGLPFFMILPQKLDLTDKEKADLVLFMKSLTDTTASRNIPQRLPKLGGKYEKISERKIGGEY